MTEYLGPNDIIAPGAIRGLPQDVPLTLGQGGRPIGTATVTEDAEGIRVTAHLPDGEVTECLTTTGPTSSSPNATKPTETNTKPPTPEADAAQPTPAPPAGEPSPTGPAPADHVCDRVPVHDIPPDQNEWECPGCGRTATRIEDITTDSSVTLINCWSWSVDGVGEWPARLTDQRDTTERPTP